MINRDVYISLELILQCAICGDDLEFYDKREKINVAPCNRCMKEELQNGINLAKSEIVLSNS